MELFRDFQSVVLFVLGLGALAAELFALVDCLRRREDAFRAADKRTKNFWLLVTGVCAAVGFVSMSNVLGFGGLLAVIGAAVYLTDVRPALMQVEGRRW